MKRSICLIACAIVLMCGACRHTDQRGWRDPPIPLTIAAGGVPIVQADAVAGSETIPIRLVVDTGSVDAITLTAADADRLHIRREARVRRWNLTVQEGFQASVERVVLGEARVDSVNAFIPDLTVQSAPQCSSVGVSLLEQFAVVEFDWRQMCMRLWLREAGPAPVRKGVPLLAWTAGRTTGEWPREGTRADSLPAVEVHLGQQPVFAVLDTGFAGDVALGATMADRLEIQPLGTQPVGPAGAGPAGVVMARTGRLLSSLRLGDLTVEHPTVLIIDDSRIAAAGGLPLVIGMGILRKFDRVAFDWASASLVLSPRDPSDRPTRDSD